MVEELAGHADKAKPARSLRAGVTPGRRAYAGRLVVVTGAGAGIGRATARAFAAHGAEVICADLDAEAAARTAEGIVKDLGTYAAERTDMYATEDTAEDTAEDTVRDVAGTAHASAVDVADAARMEAFARDVRDRHGVPDIVVNNAGIAVVGGFFDHSLDDWRKTFDVNLWGVLHGCRLFAAQMVERGQGGHIVNVASAAAFIPTRVLPAYSVSKAAVKTLSDCLRAELAGHGIGVSAICPGFVSTTIARNAVYVGNLSQEVSEEALRRRGYPPERVAAHILRAVHRNQAVVPVNPEGHLGYALSRISPAAVRGLARLARLPGNPHVRR